MMKRTADVVVVGGGVMGCSILYNLAARGVTNTLLLERHVLGSGSTGRSQAICRTHYSNPFTAAMAWESLQIYRDFQQRLGGPSGFVETGYFVMVGEEDRQAMESNVALNRTVGIDTYLVSLEEAATIAPMLDVNGVVAVAYEPRSGYADPYAVTTTYARAARELGATVQMQAEVVSLQVEDGRVTGVVTNQGIVETNTVVVAAGPWAPKLLGPLGFDIPLEPVRHQVVQIQRPWDILPHHPAVADIANKASFRPDGDQFTLIGVGEDETVDADSFNPAVDFEPAAQAFERVVQRMPALGQGYFRGGWAGLFTVTPDWHPVLDRVEGAEGVYCAVGFSGHGFKLAPMIGTVMAELVTEGQAASVDITPLRVSRFREGDLVRSSYRYSVLA